MKRVSKKWYQSAIKALSNFNVHLTLFLVVMGALWILWLAVGAGQFYDALVLSTLIWVGLLAIHLLVINRFFRVKNR
jgi:hypothetical protein